MNHLKHALLIGAKPTKREEESVKRILRPFGDNSYICADMYSFDDSSDVFVYLKELYARETLMLRVVCVEYVSCSPRVYRYHVYFNAKMNDYINSDDIFNFCKKQRIPNFNRTLIQYLIKNKKYRTSTIHDNATSCVAAYIKRGEGYYWGEGLGLNLPHYIIRTEGVA